MSWNIRQKLSYNVADLQHSTPIATVIKKALIPLQQILVIQPTTPLPVFTVLPMLSPCRYQLIQPYNLPDWPSTNIWQDMQYLTVSQIFIANTLAYEIYQLDCNQRRNTAELLHLLSRCTGLRAAKLLNLPRCTSIVSHGEQGLPVFPAFSRHWSGVNFLWLWVSL